MSTGPGTSRKHSGYGVRLIRGPFVRLAPHPRACRTDEEFLQYAAERRNSGERLAADLFCGAGGLSFGLTQAGYRVVLAADHDSESIETHRHHHPGLTIEGDLGDPAVVARLGELVRASGVELLAGGPPCQPFSKAGRSKIRHCVRNGIRPEHDERRDLWRSFLEVVQIARPPAVLMENVPDMALDREMFILRTMVHELETLGYSVQERVVETLRYGVPQFRQRLILVALRDGVAFDFPPEDPNHVTVENAISDLPEVEGGWRPEGGADGWTDYDQPKTSFQRAMREDVAASDIHRVYDHITRPVREDDLAAFDMMGEKTRYSELPEEVKRYRDDIFDDKYKRLEWNFYSRTITAHIAKDGYWYIHPRQNRTLTVREAARLQTFPDHFRFAGPPSAAFRQIGNAVPPRLGQQLGTAVTTALDKRQAVRYRTRDVARVLADWLDNTPPVSMPWLRATTRWQVVMGEILLDRAHPKQVRFVWPLLARWQTPVDTLAAVAELHEIGGWINRGPRTHRIETVAHDLSSAPELLDDDTQIHTVTSIAGPIRDLAILAVPTNGEDDAEEPVLTTKGVLRVVRRFTSAGHPAGDIVDRRNRLTDGRIALACMIGDDANARRAHLALIELAATICHNGEPNCVVCPLRTMCRSSTTPN